MKKKKKKLQANEQVKGEEKRIKSFKKNNN